MKNPCPKCGETDLTQFSKCKSRKYGLQVYCKKCSREQMKKHHDSNREQINLKAIKYRELHPEKIKEAKRKYKEKHPDRVKAQRKKQHLLRKDKEREEIYRWRKANPKRMRELRRKSNHKIYKTEKGRIRQLMATAIWESLKGNKAGRHWETLVGYTLQGLIAHLKGTIPDGYTWQDYLDGKLHLDHIIPVAAFDFTKPEDNDFKRCWALENLQLLTAHENLRKGAKIA